MENRLNVEYIPVGQLKPYEKNARKHAEYDVGQIAAWKLSEKEMEIIKSLSNKK